MSAKSNRDLVPGLYERLLDEELSLALAARPELQAILGKLDDEEAPHAYGQFLLQLIVQALRDRAPDERLPLVNRLIALISATDGLGYLQRKTLLACAEPVLLSLQPPAPGGSSAAGLARSVTPLATSSLLTGARHDPLRKPRALGITVQWRTRPPRFRRMPDFVAATTTRVRPCNPCRCRHTAGMVTRPRLENLTVVAVVAMTVEMTRRYWLSQLIYDS